MVRSHRFAWNPIVLTVLSVLAACAPDGADGGEAQEPSTSTEAVTCGPTMHVFPVRGPHNIGYDRASCGSGTCAETCPDANANSDWGGDHHGIDLFAHRGAELVAVTDGVVVAVGTPSRTSGLRVRLRDRCGWEYYYGHLDGAVVAAGQRVTAGQLLGYMGNTGTSGVHTHFNVSPDGAYSRDINPIDLLRATSPTACGAAPAPGPAPERTPDPAPDPTPAPSPTPPGGCGVLGVNQVLARDEAVRSCDGRFTFAHQGDGNVVLYGPSGPLWHTHTDGRATEALVMQDDGNLVLYGPGGPIWHSHTNGQPGAALAVQDDGNVVLYRGGAPIWSTETCCH